MTADIFDSNHDEEADLEHARKPIRSGRQPPEGQHPDIGSFCKV